MRVLVTGAAGFIGSHALRFFHENLKCELVVLDSLNYASSLDRIAWARKSGISFHLHDLRAIFNDNLCEKLGEFDYVVHFAAETHVNNSMVDPRPFVESNVNGTYNLLEYCRRHQHRLKMLFYVSTDEVYGPAPFGVDHAETAPHRPSNPYSATKAAAENLVFAWNCSMGVPCVITNTMNNIGEMQHTEKYVPMIIRRLLSGEPITVHGSPDQPGSRKYLYAADHASAIAFLMQEGRRGEKYNIVGSEEINNLEMVRRVEAAMEAEGHEVDARIRFVDFHSTRPGHDMRYSLDGSKMAAMGWTPPTSVDEALRRAVRWTIADN